MIKILPIFIFLMLVLAIPLFYSNTSLADGTYANLGTTDAADGSNDAINFSQGRVWTIDKFGKYIWVTQSRTGPSSHWAWSNDLGANWTQSSESYAALTRASVAYDSINDVLHVIWNATDTNDGVIYRRYSITRNGSNDITSIQRMDSGTVNLQLDVSSSRALEQPVALWVDDGSTDGSLVAIWLKQGTGMTEIRGSMRKLTMTSDDGVAGNWQALDNTSDTFTTDPPNVAADKIYGITSNSRVAASAMIRGGSGARKDDLYVFVAASNSSNILAYRGIWNDANNDWRGGFQSPVTVGSMNVSSGYSLKEQLITKPVLDSINDRLYVGWARWKDGINGDTVSIAYLNSTDGASSTIDIYSALGTHAYAPTIDIAYDQTVGNIYAAYVESTTNGENGSISYKSYDGSSLSSSTKFYTSPGGSAGADGGADIPILYENRSSNNRLLFAFRINGGLPPSGGNPHTIDWGYVTLAIPTSTPTPTPTSAPTNTPTPTPLAPTATPTTQQSNNAGSSTSSSSQTCTSSMPIGSPNLFQIDVSDTQAILYFAPVQGASKYAISYGYKADDERFSTDVTAQSNTGVISYTINYLSPNITYYLKVRAFNNCMPGSYGNEMKIITLKKGVNSGVRYYKDFVQRILSLFPKNVTAATASKTVSQTNNAKSSLVSCEYIVKPGDSLSKLAARFLGKQNKYKEIIDQNKIQYPTLTNSTIIRSGWKLKIGC